jgi:hypothetical protein
MLPGVLGGGQRDCLPSYNQIADNANNDDQLQVLQEARRHTADSQLTIM